MKKFLFCNTMGFFILCLSQVTRRPVYLVRRKEKLVCGLGSCLVVRSVGDLADHLGWLIDLNNLIGCRYTNSTLPIDLTSYLPVTTLPTSHNPPAYPPNPSTRFVPSSSILHPPSSHSPNTLSHILRVSKPPPPPPPEGITYHHSISCYHAKPRNPTWSVALRASPNVSDVNLDLEHSRSYTEIFEKTRLGRKIIRASHSEGRKILGMKRLR